MMAMTMARDSWTDERLDDLNTKVDRGFARVDERFAQLEARFNRFEAQVDTRFNRFEGQVDARLLAIETGIASLNRSLLGGMFVIVAALIGIIATQL
jgi:hypothetical protein